jgi:hypothetical protein
MVAPFITLSVGLVVVAIVYYGLVLPLYRGISRRRMGIAEGAITVAFFHPYW